MTPGPAHHLDAVVGDPHQRLGHRDLGHRAFDRAERAGVEHAGAPVDDQLALLEVDQVFGEHEADAFVIDQQLAEGLAAAGIVGGDLLRADAGAQPAHAVRQARGAEADLRIFEAFAGLAEHLAGGDAQIVDGQRRVAAGHRAVDGVGNVVDADRRIGQIDQEHAGALRSALAMTMPTAAPLKPVMKVLRPLITQWLPSGRHVVFIIDGIGAGAALVPRLGHEEGRARAAFDQRPEEALLQLGAADLAEQVHVALVGRIGVAGERAERRQARS